MKIISSFNNVLFDSCGGEIFKIIMMIIYIYIYIYIYILYVCNVYEVMIYQEMSVSDQVGKCVCMCVCMCVWCVCVQGWGGG